MGKFVVRTVPSGIKFDLKATNGEVIATSEVYKTKVSCLNGVKSVAKNAPVANVEDQTVEGYAVEKHPKFEVYTDKAGEFRFRLKARNGEIIGTSEGYTAKAGCLNGIESVKKNAADAEVVEDLIGIDLPDDQIHQLAQLIKAKIDLDKAGDLLGGLFGKR